MLDVEKGHENPACLVSSKGRKRSNIVETVTEK
jgi:hypothetical protein